MCGLYVLLPTDGSGDGLPCDRRVPVPALASATRRRVRDVLDRRRRAQCSRRAQRCVVMPVCGEAASCTLLSSHARTSRATHTAKIVKNGKIEVRAMTLATQRVLNAQFHTPREAWKCPGADCGADVSIWSNKCAKCARKRVFGSSRVRVADTDWLCSMYVCISVALSSAAVGLVGGRSLTFVCTVCFRVDANGTAASQRTRTAGSCAPRATRRCLRQIVRSFTACERVSESERQRCVWRGR